MFNKIITFIINKFKKKKLITNKSNLFKDDDIVFKFQFESLVRNKKELLDELKDLIYKIEYVNPSFMKDQFKEWLIDKHPHINLCVLKDIGGYIRKNLQILYLDFNKFIKDYQKYFKRMTINNIKMVGCKIEWLKTSNEPEFNDLDKLIEIIYPTINLNDYKRLCKEIIKYDEYIDKSNQSFKLKYFTMEDFFNKLCEIETVYFK